MGRTAFSEEGQLKDLLKFTKAEGYVPGLILGQSSGLKDFVIHLARSQPPADKDEKEGEKDEKDAEKEKNGEEKEKIPCYKTIADIKESAIADQARQVTWMLPGGMWVLGIFIVGPGDIFNDTIGQSKVKSVLKIVYKCLSSESFRYGNSPSAEKLVLHLNSDTNKYSCKGIDINQPNASQAFRPVDWKFQMNYTKWHQIDCHYDFEQLSPHLIMPSKATSPLRRHLKDLMEVASDVVGKAICTIDGELKNKEDSLEVTDKKKKGKTSGNKGSPKEEKNLEVNLYFNNEQFPDMKSTIQLVDAAGELRLLGSLGCRVYLHQKATVEEAVKAIKEDVLRSLSSRFEMHWDSIVEEEEAESLEERVVLHEPPRRVLIPLPYTKVALSDYIFPGEGVVETLEVLYDLLGIRVEEDSVCKEFEGQVDVNKYYELTRNPSQTEVNVPSARSLNLPILISGILFAILVLLASILIQFTGWWPKNFVF